MTSILAQDNFLSSESEGEDFNPAQEVESDEEEIRAPSKSKRSSRRTSDEDDEDDDVKVDGSPTANDDDDDEDVRRGARAGSDDEDKVEAEGDDDEEDEDDEEHEEDEDRPRKRHKRLRRMQFIDEEAEVDDEDEEEEIEDDELLEEVDDAVEMPPGAEHDDRGHRELDRQRQMAMDLDAEKQAEALRQKYGRQSRTAVAEVSGIPQHLLLPSVDDPMIWAVRCKTGKENEVINSIMKRFADRMNTREPLGISAAFVRAGSTMSGYVYVEARRKDQVDKAVEDISFCYPRTKTTLIPIKEMPDLLRVNKPKSIEPGMYCRLKRPPKYAGDLAQIVGVESNGSEVTVRVIPRLDYGLDDDLNGPQSQGAAKRKRPGGAAGRPPQRLFSEVEARKKLSRFLQQGSGTYKRIFTFQGESYEDGFLVKDVKIAAVELEDVNATLEEVTKFAAGDEGGVQNLDLNAISATLKKGTVTGEFLPEDVVEIYQGEQQGVRGKATAVQGDIVTIKVSHGPLKGEIVQAPMKTLRKLFDEGDHVKVTGASKYHGEVGMVVRVKDDRVTLVTDADNQEITVFSRDLRAALDSSGPILGSKYDLFDLVQLDAATVGCVVKVERESLKVLDQHGSVRTLLPSSITQKIDNRTRTVATDRDGNEIHVEDTVKEYSGEQRSGEVKHIHRNFIFCHDRKVMENTGIFVVRSAGVTISSAKGGRAMNSGIDLTKMNPALLQPGASNGGTMGPPKSLAIRDRLVGKTVLIKKGSYKGLLGIVKDTTDTHARVELHTRKNLATVLKGDLVMKDPITGETIQSGPGGRRPGLMGPPGGYGNNGFPARTPLAGSRTPMGVSSGGRTPAWQQGGDGGRTPAWKQGGGEGGRTPAWTNAAGARTPAWQPDGARTANPYASDGGRTSYGGTSAWGGGSKTPAYYGNSAPTPAASGSSTWGANAATPAGLDAPTPGYLAPTPAAADMPTPRGAYVYGTPAASAPTPGAFAETPGAYNAETPAAFGDDDEPRYD